MATTDLFPSIEAHHEGRLRVSDLHEIYYEQSGNPDGASILFLHGGPGSGTNPGYRRFFDPEHYRIVLFDQRGAGKSTPHASIEENTTWDLVEDIEKLRRHLSIDDWLVFGGSWGSTLATTYTTKYPDRVKGLILRGVFLCRESEIRWFYEADGQKEGFGGPAVIFPDEWEKYTAQIPGVPPGEMVEAYHKLLTSPDEPTRLQAALAWSHWEAATSTLERSGSLTDKFADPHLALSFASIENHYFRNGIFMPSDDYLLDEIRKLRGAMPVRIVQGRYDYVCPVVTAWDVKNALDLPDEDYRVVIAGHSPSEPEIRKELIRATNDFKRIA